MIIFGTQGRQQPRGIVAERCPQCEKIQRFVVVAHYEVGHVYFIPLGEGTHLQTSLHCPACGSQFFFKRSRYAEILPLQYGRTCPMDELIARTNPELAAEFGLTAEVAGPREPVSPLTLAPPPPALPASGARSAEAESTCRCPKCGFERVRPFRFCPKCGARRG